MHILLAPAKTIIAGAPMPEGVTPTTPRFQQRADLLASDMSRYTPQELAAMLKISAPKAADVYKCFKEFPIGETRRPAALSYNGNAYKYLDFKTLSPDDMLWANRRLTICSFLYGMLRPLDLINPYRLEGKVHLPATEPLSVIDSWKAYLTDQLIADVKADGGVLLNLASEEMKGFFDWQRVCSSLRVVTANFKLGTLGNLRTSSVYAKICRGAMARYVITERISDIEQLARWEFGEFRVLDSSPSELTFAAVL